jgi:hypothetical protein
VACQVHAVQSQRRAIVKKAVWKADLK